LTQSLENLREKNMDASPLGEHELSALVEEEAVRLLEPDSNLYCYEAMPPPSDNVRVLGPPPVELPREPHLVLDALPPLPVLPQVPVDPALLVHFQLQQHFQAQASVVVVEQQEDEGEEQVAGTSHRHCPEEFCIIGEKNQIALQVEEYHEKLENIEKARVEALAHLGAEFEAKRLMVESSFKDRQEEYLRKLHNPLVHRMISVGSTHQTH